MNRILKANTERELDALAAYLIWRMANQPNAVNFYESQRRKRLGEALFRFLTTRPKLREQSPYLLQVEEKPR